MTPGGPCGKRHNATVASPPLYKSLTGPFLLIPSLLKRAVSDSRALFTWSKNPDKQQLQYDGRVVWTKKDQLVSINLHLRGKVETIFCKG